jgi:AGZA family xanthine/uracil permease-like MFS transporter
MFDFFKKVVTFHPIEKILVVQEWDISGYGGQFGLAFITCKSPRGRTGVSPR